VLDLMDAALLVDAPSRLDDRAAEDPGDWEVAVDIALVADAGDGAGFAEEGVELVTVRFGDLIADAGEDGLVERGVLGIEGAADGGEKVVRDFEGVRLHRFPTVDAAVTDETEPGAGGVPDGAVAGAEGVEAVAGVSIAIGVGIEQGGAAGVCMDGGGELATFGFVAGGSRRGAGEEPTRTGTICSGARPVHPIVW
jgi:hypothetical protein